MIRQSRQFSSQGQGRSDDRMEAGRGHGGDRFRDDDRGSFGRDDRDDFRREDGRALADRGDRTYEGYPRYEGDEGWDRDDENARFGRNEGRFDQAFSRGRDDDFFGRSERARGWGRSQAGGMSHTGYGGSMGGGNSTAGRTGWGREEGSFGGWGRSQGSSMQGSSMQGSPMQGSSHGRGDWFQDRGRSDEHEGWGGQGDARAMQGGQGFQGFRQGGYGQGSMGYGGQGSMGYGGQGSMGYGNQGSMGYGGQGSMGYGNQAGSYGQGWSGQHGMGQGSMGSMGSFGQSSGGQGGAGTMRGSELDGRGMRGTAMGGWGQSQRDVERPHLGKGPKGYTRSDDRIREEVCDCLSDGYVDASNVEVDVKSGVVTLSGHVSDKQTKRQIEDMVEACRGVKTVENQIRVQAVVGSPIGMKEGTTSTTSTSMGQGSTNGSDRDDVGQRKNPRSSAS